MRDSVRSQIMFCLVLTDCADANCTTGEKKIVLNSSSCFCSSSEDETHGALFCIPSPSPTHGAASSGPEANCPTRPLSSCWGCLLRDLWPLRMIRFGHFFTGVLGRSTYLCSQDVGTSRNRERQIRFVRKINDFVSEGGIDGTVPAINLLLVVVLIRHTHMLGTRIVIDHYSQRTQKKRRHDSFSTRRSRFLAKSWYQQARSAEFTTYQVFEKMVGTHYCVQDQKTNANHWLVDWVWSAWGY